MMVLTRPDPEQSRVTTGRKHPDTSLKAAERALPSSGSQRAKVLNLLKDSYPGGYTDEEMVDILGLNPNSQRPRRVELCEMKWIEDSQERRPTRSGEEAIVWRYVGWANWFRSQKEEK
jgi:hypothetical protein